MNAKSGENGFIGIGLLLAFFGVISAMTLLCEFYRVFTIRKSVATEITSVLNSSIEVSVMDDYRRDHVARIDEGKARDAFYEYLCADLNLRRLPDGALEAGIPGEGGYFALDIAELTVEASPPQMRVRGDIIIRPGLIGGIVPEPQIFRLPFSRSSVNRRID